MVAVEQRTILSTPCPPLEIVRQPLPDLDPNHLRARASETRVAQVLSKLPFIRETIVFPPYSKEDEHMTDVVASFYPLNLGFYIDDINIQVKSSNTGISQFRESLKSKSRNIPAEERAEYLRNHRLIRLNGGERLIRPGNGERGYKLHVPVTDEEIQNSFLTQVARIEGTNLQEYLRFFGFL